MTTNTNITLPPTVPAGRQRKPRQTAAQKAAAQQRAAQKHVDFAKWKAALNDANQVVDYQATSPIHGLTDMEVLPKVIQTLDGIINGTSQNTMDDTKLVRTCLVEMQKRKAARLLASKTYRS
jgi:hypothetical protein